MGKKDRGRQRSFHDVAEIQKMLDPFLDSAIVGYTACRELKSRNEDLMNAQKYLELMDRGLQLNDGLSFGVQALAMGCAAKAKVYGKAIVIS